MTTSLKVYTSPPSSSRAWKDAHPNMIDIQSSMLQSNPEHLFGWRRVRDIGHGGSGEHDDGRRR
jgi:hypothetical protein